MAGFKNGKIMLPIKEFLIVKGQATYELNTIDMSKVTAFYRKFNEQAYLETYVEMPKGDYRINETGGNKQLEITNLDILDEYYSIQLARLVDLTSSIYDPSGEIDIITLNQHMNEVISDVQFLFDYIKNVGMVIDSSQGNKILSELLPNTTWFMDENGNMATLPVNELFEQIETLVEKIHKEALGLLTQDYNKLSQQLKDETTLLIKSLSDKFDELVTESKEVLDEYTQDKIQEIKEICDRLLSLEDKLWKANTIEGLKRLNLKEGDVVEVLGYYTAGDGANHKRVIADSDDGSGVLLENGLYANIVHDGKINVSWFGAKSNVSEDQSSFIQKAINYCCVESILIIDNKYQIDNSITLPNTTMNMTIIGYKGVLDYKGNDTAFKMEITRGSGVNNFPQYIYVSGLKIKGNYKNVGISIKQFNNWKLEDIQVWNCMTGIVLSDTYYGEISGKSTIRECLVGVHFNAGTESEEVNTIKLDNLGINLAIEKTQFIPKNQEESEEDYNNRVISRGIYINSLIMGVKFQGLIIEGQDYGIHSEVYKTGNGANVSLYSINECYFEAIKQKNIFINNYEDGKLIIAPIVNMYGNRFFNKDKPIEVDIGVYNIFGNENVKLITNKSSGRRLSINTDLQLDYLSESIQMYKSSYFPTNTDKYSFGGNDVYPTDIKFWKTWERDNRIMFPLNAGLNVEAYPKYSITTYPLSFEDRKNSVFLKDENNKFYSLIYQDGKLRSKLVNNEYLIHSPSGVKTAIFAQSKIEDYQDGDKIKLLELNTEVTKKNNVWTRGNFNISLIGTADYFSKNLPSQGTYFSPQVYNLETGFIYVWQNNYWSWVSSDCSRVYSSDLRITLRAIGTTEERPNLAGKKIRYCFVYYNTDTSKYEMFKNDVWEDWDKVVRIDTDDYYVEDEVLQLNTPYHIDLMEQKGGTTKQDFYTYLGEKFAYDKQLEAEQKAKYKAYQQALTSNPNLTYEEFIASYPMMLPNIEEPTIPESVQKFMEKYLGTTPKVETKSTPKIFSYDEVDKLNDTLKNL